ncbi:MAG: HPr family phosphocarrier protein [Deltaproteobacteria bacterium]|jgi:phosphotransferase system HPr (HPr) family protein|nr:HPr family phosphocarrier protein [Deltaproteobacteria bacterium]
MDALLTDQESDNELRVSKRVTIKNRLGLHARAAAKLAKAAQTFKSEVSLAHDRFEADARSILALISLGCAYNSEVTLQAAGEDASDALTTLTAIIEDRFGEE